MNVPKLRFPEFSGEWEEKKLGNFGVFKNGVNGSKEDFGHGFPLVNLMDVFGKNFVSNSDFELFNVSEKGLKEYNLVKGDVLFIRSSVKPTGVGLTAVITEDLNNTVYGGFLIRFREKKCVLDLNYKKYCFYTNKFRNALLSKSSTSANTNINQDNLKILLIDVPSIAEQEKIASFLSKVDEKIEKLDEKGQLWQNYKKGMIQQFFIQKLRFKDEKGNDYPDWEEKKLEDISRKVIAGGTPSTSKKEYWENGTIPWMSSGEINKKIVKSVDKCITKEGYQNSSTKMIPINSVLIGLAGQGKTRGTVAVNEIELCTNQSLASIITNKDKLCHKYLFYNLESRYEELRALSSSDGGRGGLNLKLIKSIKIMLPHIEEQEKIANFLSSIDRKIENINKELEINKQFKKGLLQQMFPSDKKSRDIKTKDLSKLQDKQEEQSALL